MRGRLLLLLLLGSLGAALCNRGTPLLPNEINWDAKRIRALQPLRVGSVLSQQVLKIGEDTVRYSLAGLLPDSGYEVRVSYPGTIDASVRVRFASPKQLRSRGGGRRLLDVEKLEFRTNSSGQVAGLAASEAVVLVSSKRSGVVPRGLPSGGDILVYDITLSPIVHGLPAEAMQLRYWLAGCVLFAVVGACWAPVGGRFDVHPWRRMEERWKA